MGGGPKKGAKDGVLSPQKTGYMANMATHFSGDGTRLTPKRRSEYLSDLLFGVQRVPSRAVRVAIFDIIW